MSLFLRKFLPFRTALAQRSLSALGFAFVASLSSPSAHAINEFQAREYSYVFVDGMFGEFANNNFDGMVDRIYSVDESADVTVLRPQTTLTFEENAETLLKHPAISQPKKPLIIFAHSRGAAEVMLALFKAEEAVLENIAQAVLIQGAFYGSPLSGKSVEKFEEWCQTKMGQRVKQLCDESSSFLVGFRGLSPAYVHATFFKALAQSNSQRLQQIREKVSFVRASTTLKTASLPFKLLHLYLKRLGFPQNDGIVVTSQQKLPNLGLDLGVHLSYHTSLTGAHSKRQPEPGEFLSYLLKRLWANGRIEEF